MSANGGYPTQARVAIYDTNEIAVRVYWFDTYYQAVTFAKSFGDNDGRIVGTIDIVEVVA